MIDEERMQTSISDIEILQNEYQGYAAYAERHGVEEEIIKHFERIAESLEIAINCMKVMDGYDEV